MTRDEALRKLEEPLYPSEKMLQEDKKFLADYMGVSVGQLEEWIALPPKRQSDYPHSWLNEIAPIARKFRKIIE